MAIVRNISFFVNGHNIADAITGFTFQADSEELDATTVASSGAFREYVQGFKTGSLQANGIFDSDTANADEIHDILSAAYDSGTEQNVTTSLGTIAVGEPAILMNGCQMTYEMPFDTGALIFSNATWRANSGIKFGRWLANDQLDAGTTNGTSVDNGASSSNGATLTVHLFNDDATDCDFKLQHSTDDNTWADVSGAVVNNLSATHTSGSITVTGTINRYTRLVSTITGGDTILVSAAVARG